MTCCEQLSNPERPNSPTMKQLPSSSERTISMGKVRDLNLSSLGYSPLQVSSSEVDLRSCSDLFSSSDEPAILALAFQEIVQLTPQMIMLTDPEKKRRWEAHILQTIAERPGKKSDYILLRSGQLVGTALIILIKAEIAGDLRNVEIATKKVCFCV